MTVWALGINHETAPLDVRGRFAVPTDLLEPTVRDLRAAIDGIAETTLLSTCNRTEIYTSGDKETLQRALTWLAQTGGVNAESLANHVYTLHDNEAARHAFRVASGLDSMVLGEAQILGQMKDAVRAAEAAGTLGTTLHQLFQRSFAVAKEVRTVTEIGAHSISMTAAAVRLAGQLFEDLNDVNVLFVGAGEMIELAATHFAAKNPKRMVIANRTAARGEALAKQFGAQTMLLADLPEHLGDFDVVVSCTASTLPLIGLGAVERALKKRRHKPMFMVDLAVPRDIEPDVQNLDDVYLYTVDELADVVRAGKENRQAAVGQAEAIIETGVSGFMQWLSQRDAVPAIQQVQARAQQWREAELAKAKKLLAKNGDPEAALQALAHGLTQKMLHGALSALNSPTEAERAAALDAVQRLLLRGGDRER